jgi:nitrogen fixation/metabolism regulation signal transduction histidine kinase
LKTVRTYPKHEVIHIGALILTYLLLCALALLFSRSFFTEMFREGAVPEPLGLVAFFTVPAVMLILLVISVFSLLRDRIARRSGSRLNLRLLGYFILIVFFSAVPVTVITARAVSFLASFWRTIDVYAAMGFAEDFALTAYFSSLERSERVARELFAHARLTESETADLPHDLVAIQDFTLSKANTWECQAFFGNDAERLAFPPSVQLGFTVREIPRDRDRARYVLYIEPKLLRVLSFSLGTGFDRAVQTIQAEKARFETISRIITGIKPFLLIFYGVFFFPILLMTLIIAVSFTRKVTRPIAELTEATRQVASGDFSIHIQARPKDELGILIRSFTGMVQDLKRSQAALVKAEKISTWQTMAEQLAHEIKNPLTPIRLSAERTLRRWQNDPARIGEIIEPSMRAIIQETEGLSALLAEFRTLSRPGAPSVSWTNLWDAAEEIITPYRSSYPKVVFSTARLRPDITVKIDRQRLSQVLTNLIINGIDAMDGAGAIEIQASLVKKRETRYCRVSIADTGKGVTRDESSRIFTPYFTTKPKGTGLGLAIVERIVDEHGGSVWFNSAEGLGTTFFVDLPVAETLEDPEGSVFREKREARGEEP